MANTKEIQNRIKSIKDTQKITNAMYMISSSKLKKARTDLENTEPYFYTLQVALARMLRHVPEMEHLYFDSREGIKEEDRRRGYLVITADKGMAGAYNHNVIKIAEQELAAHPNSELYVVGQVGRHYFAKKGVPIDIHFQYTAQNPSLHRARVIADKMLENYENGDIDEVYIIYTNMKSSVVVEPQMIQLLPMKRTDFAGVPADVFHEEITMEPSPKAVLDRIVPNCVMGYIYGALVESFCSEQNSRMMAMDSATKSAKEMLDDLNIKYNRARQAAITKEITEIAGGARAQRDRS